MGCLYAKILNLIPPRDNPPKPNYRDKQIVEEANFYVLALYSYEPVDDGDLKFSRGDKLKITNSNVPGSDGWWMAQHCKTLKTGLVPSNFLTLVDDSETENFKKELWWFDVDRRTSVRQLIFPGNPLGTFLIRNSKDESMFTLSVRNFDDSSENADIRNYHIKFKSDDSTYFIAARQTFKSLKELVAHYQESADGLCCKLSEPCPRKPETIPFKNLEIKRSDLILIQKIGGGKFGEVWKGKYKNKVEVAVKKMIPGKMSTERFLDEAKTMHSIRHHSLLQLMGVVTADEPIYIVTELMENGCLLDYMKNDQGQNVKFINILDIAAQVSEGMAYLELNNYIHRDLRAANVLVGQKLTIKIADFGLAKLLFGDEYEMSKDSVYPIRWAAPESVAFRTWSIKSDVWSFGIFLYELVTYGRQPYAGMTSHDAVFKVECGYRLPNPENPTFKFIVCPEKMYSEMLKCWNSTPQERPTFEHLKGFFNDYYVETEKPYQAEEF